MSEPTKDVLEINPDQHPLLLREVRPLENWAECDIKEAQRRLKKRTT